MAGRIRTIKPEWLDDELSLASPEARVLSVALLLLADDYGRGRANKTMLGSRAFPASPKLLDKAMNELVDLGYVSQYTVRRQTYFQITNWTKHQRVDRPGRPLVPAPEDADTENCCIRENSRDPRENSRDPRENSRTFATDLRPTTYDHDLYHDLERAYAQYPRKAGKKAGLAAAVRKIRTPDDLVVFAAAIRTMAKAWEGHDTQFCPHFSTFVNQERWRDDELPLPRPRQKQRNVTTFTGELS